jgi:hypothetical protein
MDLRFIGSGTEGRRASVPKEFRRRYTRTARTVRIQLRGFHGFIHSRMSEARTDSGYVRR